MSNPLQVHDLMIVFDAVTGGTDGVTELKQAIPDIINFVCLSDCFERIGVLAYRNYAYPTETVIQWSGWCYPSCDLSSSSTGELLNFVQDLIMPLYGTDPKAKCASKTALAKAYLEMRRDGTILLLYAHALPVLEHMGGYYCDQEQTSLDSEYGNAGPYFKDWITGTKVLAGIESVSSGAKKAVVLSFALGSLDNPSEDFTYWSPYLYLSYMTGGDLYRTIYSGRDISRLTIGLLLIWMRVDGNIDIPKSIRVAYKYDPNLVYAVSEASLQNCCGPYDTNLDKFNTLAKPRNYFRLPYDGVSTNNQQVSKFTSRNLAKHYIDRSEYYKTTIANHLNELSGRRCQSSLSIPYTGSFFALSVKTNLAPT